MKPRTAPQPLTDEQADAIDELAAEMTRAHRDKHGWMAGTAVTLKDGSSVLVYRGRAGITWSIRDRSGGRLIASGTRNGYAR